MNPCDERKKKPNGRCYCKIFFTLINCFKKPIELAYITIKYLKKIN